MLAKELKIRFLNYQREHILFQINQSEDQRFNGNATVYYYGHLFSENKAYFENEGFTITEEMRSDGTIVTFLNADVELSMEERRIMEAEWRKRHSV